MPHLTASASTLRRCAPGRATGPGPATNFLLFALLAVVAGIGAPLAFAIGPTLPLRFADSQESRDPWVARLQVDPERIRVVRVTRNVYVDGVRVRSEDIEAKYERQTSREHEELTAQLPLRLKAMEEFKERPAFTQEIVVEGQWIKPPGAKPLVVQQWFYFVARRGEYERVDMETYSALTDRPEASTDSRGKSALVHTGRELKGSVPLSETKKSFAIPVGRLGGAVEENVSPDDQRKKPDEDPKPGK